MAKRQRNGLITASFHYLVKVRENPEDRANPIEEGFSAGEYQRVINRISNPDPLNDRNPEVIGNIKSGRDLPFSGYEIIDGYIHFGNFDAAYYGLQYRNNLLGVISAESLNLRPFNYLVTRLNDGKIVIAVTYTGNFGDYDGLKNCFLHILRGNRKIESRTIKSISDEIGAGEPIELKLTYRKPNQEAGHRSLFDSTGVIAIKNTDYGAGFQDEVNVISNRVRGSVQDRKRILAAIASEGELLELNDEDIVSCTAIVREGRRERTVYLLGENNFATKFLLNVGVDQITGAPIRDQVRDEMIRVMRDRITPLLRR